MGFYVIEKVWTGIESPVQILASTERIEPFPARFDLGTIDIVRLYAFCRPGDIAHPEKYLWAGKYNETSRGYTPTNVNGEFIEEDIYKIRNLGYSPVRCGKEQLSVWAAEGATTDKSSFTFLLEFSSYLRLKIRNKDGEWDHYGAFRKDLRNNIPDSWKIVNFCGNWVVVKLE